MTYLKPSTVAKMLDCSPRTIKRWIGQGWLRGKRLKSGHWRIEASSVEKMLNGVSRVDKILASLAD
jgi:excisionase family DNA binding protein